MEIDFSELSLKNNLWLVLTGMAVVLLGGLGWYVLPDRVLTWTEWQVLKQHSEYRREVRTLETYADELAALLQETPDPVRTQLLVEQMYDALDTRVQLQTLAGPKDALLTAGDVILEWALGTAEKQDAALAMSLAQKRIQVAAERVYGQ